MRKLKVLGFDGWTMGSHHYVRLLPAFKDLDIELLLVHLGSWGEDKNREKEENINGLITRDISYYENEDFDQILDFEKPDLVLFLSTETFAHRAFQRYCKVKKIPTIYLYHGFCSINFTDGKTEILHSTFIGLMRFIFGQAYKSIRYTLPNYAKSLWRTSATWSEWMRLIQDVTWRLKGKTIFMPAKDAAPTKCCVYIAADIQDAVSRFQMSKCDVVVVGNPDLLAFELQPEDIGTFDYSHFSEKTNVMYIDAGLSSLGLNFQSIDEYAEYIKNIDIQLKQQNKNLLFKIKPHPSEYKEYLSDALMINGIQVVANIDFIAKLKTCCACITEPSTLGLIPGLLGMPLFMHRSGPLRSLTYGNVFTSYQPARYLDDICHFSELLSEIQALFDPLSVTDWIHENSGPLPAADMPKRVVQVVVDLIRAKNNT